MTNTSLDDIAEVDFFRNGRVDAVCLERMLESDDTKLGRSQGLKRTVDRTDWGSGGGDDDNFACLSRLITAGVSKRRTLALSLKLTMARRMEDERGRKEEVGNNDFAASILGYEDL